MNSFIGLIWNQDPLVFSFDEISIKWWFVYLIIIILILIGYFYETSFWGEDVEGDKSIQVENYLNKEWYFNWRKKVQHKNTGTSNKNKKKSKSTPKYTISFIFIIFFARFVYCNKRLHDISAFFQPLNSECLQFNPELHWYALCWVIGLAGAYFIVKWLYKTQLIPDILFDPLFLYCFIGILLGARLGHCLFYEPDYFIFNGHITEMFIPIRTHSDGTAEFTGFAGLASHGGTIGLMIALWLYCKYYSVNIWYVLDNIAIATGFTACFIRIGNFMNSEIVGKITTLDATPWAIWFQRNDSAEIYRHPGQLYEAFAYILLFIISIILYKLFPKKVGSGFYFGLCLTYIFTFRFFIEYTKEIQEAFEASLPIDMGQILSIPFIIIGVICMIGGKWMKNLGARIK